MVLNWKTIFCFRLESWSTIQFVPGSGLFENMEKKHDYHWDDGGCAGHYKYICEARYGGVMHDSDS